MPKKKAALSPIPIPLPILLAAPSSPLSGLQAQYGGVPLPVRAEDYVAALEIATRMIAKDRDKGVARGFVQKLHESTKKHRPDPMPARPDRRLEERVSIVEGHMGSLQRALKEHQARLDSLSREVDKLGERSERSERSEAPRRPGEPLYPLGHARERSYNGDYNAFGFGSQEELRIGEIVRGAPRTESTVAVIHSRSASANTPAHSRSPSEGYPASRSDPGHGQVVGPGVCSTSMTPYGSQPNTPGPSPGSSGPSAAAAYAARSGSAARGAMEVLQSDVGFDDPNDPFAGPLTGGVAGLGAGKRTGLVASPRGAVNVGEVMLGASGSSSGYAPGPASARPSPSSAGHSQNQNGQPGRAVRELEDRVAQVEEYIGFVPGMTYLTPTMDQRLVRLEMSMGQLVESDPAMPADSMYDSLYQD